MIEIIDMNWVAQGIRLSVPLVFAALGGLLSERAGVINIALEGKMLFGAFAGVAVTWWTGTNLLGLVAALAVGAGIGWVHAWFSIAVRADQIVSATAINLFALGVTAALIPAVWEGGRANTPGVERFHTFEVPVLADLPVVGTVFTRLSWFDYGALALAPVVWVVLWRSPFGLRLRACGESPEAAASVGVDVIRTRYAAVMLAGVFAAMGPRWRSKAPAVGPRWAVCGCCLTNCTATARHTDQESTQEKPCMEIAVQTPPEHTDFSRLRDIWQTADGLGFAAGFTFDHFVPLNPGARPSQPGGTPDGPQLEGWITLAALGAATSRLDVGTLVTGVTYRHPVLLAKMAVTLDHVTAGRALLGLGAAWHEPEHAMYGFDYPGVGDRMTMLDETLEAFKLLCSADGPVDYEGKCVQLAGACFDPKPLRPGGVPVLVGGGGERLRRIVARRADWYNGFWAPWEWPEVNDGLDELLDRNGRRPGDLKRTVFVFSELTNDPATTEGLVKIFQSNRGGTTEQVRSRIVAGSPEQMVSVLESYAAAGVDMAILNIRPDQGAADVERFGQHVLPAFDRRT